MANLTVNEVVDTLMQATTQAGMKSAIGLELANTFTGAQLFTTAAPAIRIAKYGSNIEIYDDDNTTLRFRVSAGRTQGLDGFSDLNNTVAFGVVTYPELALPVTGQIGWSADGTFYGTNDMLLVRDAAHTLALKNGSNACAIRIYGNTTGSKYASLSHNGTNALLNASSGNLLISSLPTANPGAGILWNNGGTPAIGT